MKATSLGMRAVPISGEIVLRSYEDVDFAFRSALLDNGELVGDIRVPTSQGKINAPLLGDTLSALDGSEHFARRRIESELFRSTLLSHYERGRVQPMVRSTLERVRNGHYGEAGRADLLMLTRGLLTTITAAVVGLDGVDSPEESGRFVTLMDQVAEGATAIYFHDRQAAVEAGVRAREQIVERYLQPSLERRRRRARTGATQQDDKTDLLTLFVVHHDHFAQWDRDLLLRETALYVRGSAHTTTNGLSHAVAELDEWLAPRADHRERLRDPEFLGRAFEEAIRLHPSTPMQWLVARAPVLFPSGVAVETGETVAVSFVDANRDPRVFGLDAECFDPDREVPERVRRHGLAFGGGVHTCIGKPLVLGDQRGGVGGREGTGRLILRKLYAAGMRMDPDRAPVPHQDMTGHYASFPVMFDRLRG